MPLLLDNRATLIIAMGTCAVTCGSPMRTFYPTDACTNSMSNYEICAEHNAMLASMRFAAACAQYSGQEQKASSQQRT